MTVDDVRAKVAEIDAIKNDDERAHSMEDDLYADVLNDIAEGMSGRCAAALAAEALKTVRIDFARWCA